MQDIKRIMVIASEPSGDHLAADFIKEVRKISPNIEIRGMGGPQMAAAGVNSEVPIEGLAILGLVEAFGALKSATQKAREIALIAAQQKPDAVIAVDSWGFTLRAGQQIRKLLPNVRLIKMVGPQVWATRPGRAKTLAKTYNELWCIHEFELPFYDGLDIKASVIGNPALRKLKAADPADFIARHNLGGKTIVGILPGSRSKEIERVAPAMFEAAKILSAKKSDLVFLCVAASAIKDELMQCAEQNGAKILVVDEKEKADAFAVMKAAMACSGTVTSELAASGVPVIIGYAVDNFSYFIIRNFLMRTKFITLLNVAMGQEIAPEFIQENLNPNNLAQAVSKLIESKEQHKSQVDNQNRALSKMGLGKPPAALNAARLLFNLDPA